MKHQHGNRILGRVANHRQQLLLNLCRSLLVHGAITTTAAKAKELRKFFEPLVRLAQTEANLHRQRQLLQRLGRPTDVARLIEVANASAARRGGYMRLTRVPSNRQDAAQMMRVEIIDSKS